MGCRMASHGPAWQELVRLAGHEPRRCLTIESVVERPAPDLGRYEHICPICHVRRFAKRPQPRWRCVACQNAGLEGKLIIQSRPKTREAVDV